MAHHVHGAEPDLHPYRRSGFDRTGRQLPGGQDHARIAAYADTDETNAAIGIAIALGALQPDIQTVLQAVQHDLFDVGADLCTPIADGESRLRVRGADVARLEAYCDEFNERLTPLRSFVLSGGTPGAALLHGPRTAARRAERSAWALIETDTELSGGDRPTVSSVTARYLNRLSDLLVTFARLADDGGNGDVLWEPGSSR